MDSAFGDRDNLLFLASAVRDEKGKGSSFVRDGAQVSSFGRPAASAPPASGVGRAAGGSIRSRDRALVRAFGAWLREEDPGDVEGVLEEVALFEQLVVLAREEGIDLNDPDDLALLIDILLDGEGWDVDDPDDGAVLEALETLHDYVHFRIATDGEQDAWEAAHEDIEIALAEFDDGDGVVADAIETTAALGAAERWAALTETRMIAGVAEVLEWIGAGRPITSTGGVRRADIARVAGMIGIQAVGVSKRTASEPGEPVQATTMYDVPMLAAWWEALQIAEVIELSATRVRRGPAGERWGTGGGAGARAGAGAGVGAGSARGAGAGSTRGAALDADAAGSGIELAEQVIGLVVADLVTGAGVPANAMGDDVVRARVEAVLAAVDPEREGPDLEELDMWQQYVVAGLIVDLIQLGLVDPAGEAGPEVPVALKAAVAKGATLAMAYFAAMNGLLD